jgi:hypothetical protein
MVETEKASKTLELDTQILVELRLTYLPPLTTWFIGSSLRQPMLSSDEHT